MSFSPVRFIRPVLFALCVITILVATGNQLFAQGTTRDALFGNLLGAESRLAERGIIADIDLTQFYQGVSSGGADYTPKYGGKLDYNFIFMGEKLGLWKGFVTLMHAETRFGESVTNEGGALAFPNVNMIYPSPVKQESAITGLLLMQYFSESFAVAAGKINVLDFWSMVYPDSGRGIDGFMNLNSIVIGMPWLRFVNPSVSGAGALVMKGKQIRGGLLVFDTNNSTNTAGIDNLFDKGACIMGMWRFFTNYGGKPGSHLFVGGWSSRTYTSLDRSDWTFLPGIGGGLTPGEKEGAWALAYNFEQLLWVDARNPERKIRLFTGASLSDGNPSFARWGTLVSLEAFGLFRGREKDRMGVSYFYNGVSEDFKQLVSPVVQLEDVQGVELYYNAAITNWFHLTGDMQVVDNENASNDTAIILGLRGKVDF